jgi:TonB family protein
LPAVPEIAVKRVLICLALSASALLGGCGPTVTIVAQERFARPGMTEFAWTATPNGQDILSVYPPQLLDAGIPGEVIVLCTFMARGVLGDCAVERETPAGKGFGPGALEIMSRFRFDPRVYPEMVGARGRQTISFRVI